METIEKIEEAVDRTISVVTAQLEALREIKILLSSEALKGISIQSDFQLTSFSQNGSQVKNFNSILYRDYPLNVR